MRTAETGCLAAAGNPGLAVEAKEDVVRVNSVVLMVEFPNDGRGRESEGRWVVKEEVVGAAVAIWKR